MAGGVISPLYTGVKARRNGTPCITPAACTYICTYNQYTSFLPLVTGPGTIRISVYRKLRSGSVKSSALNGRGQTYAETWEIAALPSHSWLLRVRLYVHAREKHQRRPCTDHNFQRPSSSLSRKKATIYFRKCPTLGGRLKIYNTERIFGTGACLANVFLFPSFLEFFFDFLARWKIYSDAPNAPFRYATLFKIVSTDPAPAP